MQKSELGKAHGEVGDVHMLLKHNISVAEMLKKKEKARRL